VVAGFGAVHDGRSAAESLGRDVLYRYLASGVLLDRVVPSHDVCQFVGWVSCDVPCRADPPAAECDRVGTAGDDRLVGARRDEVRWPPC
jgi:hypothetical protein